MILVALLLAAAPELDLPPEDAAPPVRFGAGGEIGEREMLTGLQEQRLHASDTVVGGYGQLDGNLLFVGPGSDAAQTSATASVRRLVLFVSHSFPMGFRVYTELEWENALACATCLGSSEVEQAFVEWAVVEERSRDVLALRAGLVLVPIGILNQWHEPPVFHGVERSRLEEGGVIPSTWRELGVGVTSAPIDGVHLEGYLTTGLDPEALRENGLVNARKNGSLVDARSLQVSARAEVEPFLGMLAGVSVVAGDMGGRLLGVRRFTDAQGDPVALFVPLYLVDGDARVRKWGFEARTVVAAAFMPKSGDLMQVGDESGTPLFRAEKGGVGALPTRMLGASLEVAYDVLDVPRALLGWETSQELLPFARVEYVDQQSEVPAGYERDARLDTKELTLGVTWRPIRQVALKSDVQWRNRRLGLDEVEADVGLGFMF